MAITPWTSALAILRLLAVVAFLAIPPAQAAEGAGQDESDEEAAAPATVGFISLGDAADATELTVTPGSELQLPFTIETAPKSSQEPIEIYVTPFRGVDKGVYISPTASILELPDLEEVEHRLTVPLGRPIMTLRLSLPDFPPGDKYAGQVVVLQQGKVIQSAALTLVTTKVEKLVALVVDRPAVPATDSLWPGFIVDPLRFTLQVHNSDDEWQAEGVYLRVLEVTGPDHANLDPNKHLTFLWNGADAGDMLRSPDGETVTQGRENGTKQQTAPRSIAAGKQANVTGTVQGLPAGEYTVKFGVSAANAKADSQPEVTVTLRVRHSVVWPVLILMLAIVLSFIATKGLDAQRKRVAVLKQVAKIRPPWLREGPSTLPVVAARAVLRQAETRYRLWWNALFAPGAVGDRVTKAAELLKLIKRTRGIRADIERWNQNMMIRNRAEKRLNSIVADLDLETIDEKTTAAIETRLNELESWLSSDKLYELYWLDMKSDLDKLLARVKADDFPAGDARDMIARLIAGINEQVEALAKTVQPEADGTKPTQDLSAYLDVEEDYAKLKVLSERLLDGDNDALSALIACLKHDPEIPIQDFFKLFDDIAWERLKDACKPGSHGMEFTAPRRSSIQPLGAFQLIHFEVAPKDRKLGHNYLFKHGLEYRWLLELQTPRGKKKQLLTQETTKAPRLIQYVPQRGDLYVSVEMRREGHGTTDPVSIEPPLEIAASSESSWTSAFRAAEVMAFAIAAVFAVVSGLGTYYFNEPTFGSPQDYIALFIWGAGVDQAKNFIQNLERAQPGQS